MVKAQSVHEWPKLGSKLLHGGVGPSFLVPHVVHTLIVELSSRCDVAYMNSSDPELVNATYCFILSPQDTVGEMTSQSPDGLL